MVDSRDPPSEAQRRLADQLCSLRLRSGLSGKELGDRCGWSQSKVSKIENARQAAAVPDVRAWAEAVGASVEEADGLAALAEQVLTETRSWRVELVDGLAAKQTAVGLLEQQARIIRTCQTSTVPGLLQTAAYAQGLFRFGQRVGAHDVAAGVAARLRRQEILYEPGKRFEFVITEAALRWRPVPAPALAAQLGHIAAMIGLPNVRLDIVPLDGDATAFHHSFVIFDEPPEALVTVETLVRELTLRDPDDLALHLDTFAAMQQAAVSDDDARTLLADLRTRLLRSSAGPSSATGP